MRLKTLRSSKGFTLIEIIFVLAIVAVLAGILVPLAISSLSDADKQKTRSDQDAIAAALTSFRKDVNRWPDNSSTTSTLNFAVEYLLVGDNATTGISSAVQSGECPGDTAGANKFFANTACPGTAPNNAFNHLVINNPNGNVTEGDATTGDYDPKKWAGPYGAKFNPDGFGRAHVIYVAGIDKTNTTGVAGARGWILSAGADNTLQTQTTDTTVSGDDIGFIYCTKCN